MVRRLSGRAHGAFSCSNVEITSDFGRKSAPRRRASHETQSKIVAQTVMEISDLLSPTAVFAGAKAASKKKLLQELSEKAALHTGLSARRIFETLIERERLGSTGMGQGVAIPHGHLEGVERMTGLFVRMGSPVDFESIDEQPVDLLFLLLAPPGAGADHLKALARVSRLLRNRTVCEKLRAASNPAALYALLTEPTASSQAA